MKSNTATCANDVFTLTLSDERMEKEMKRMIYGK